MKSIVMATAFLALVSIQARAGQDGRIAQLYSPKQPSVPSLNWNVAKIKCTCGSKSVEEDKTCTAPAKPTCVCSSPGNNPSIECK
jgi:hypothetical protein